MVERARCWLWGHEKWSDLDGNWFCMRCLANKGLGSVGSLDRSAGFRALQQSYAAIAEQQRGARAAIRNTEPRLDRLLGMLWRGLQLAWRSVPRFRVRQEERGRGSASVTGTNEWFGSMGSTTGPGTDVSP